MRGHVIFAVLNRNLMSFFSSVAGYLFICVFVVAAALCAFNAQFFTNNLATLDQLTKAFPYLLLFIIPAITMTAWADEKRQGTDELLFTLPASDVEILIGKYLALVLVYSIALAFSLTNFIILAVYADPDWGMLITTYFGYWLAGAALISAGMFASVLTSNVTVAFVAGSVMCAIPVFVGLGASHPLPEDATLSQQFSETLVEFGRELSLGERLREFNLGIVPFSGLVYFGSLIAFFLYLNAGMIGRRHWVKQPDGIPVGVHFAVRGLCLIVALIAGNAIVTTASESIGLRFDMTSEKIYTLSDTTSDVLEAIKSENPVTIQAFLSPDVPREYVSHHTQLKGLLRQYSRQSGSLVEVRFVDVEPYSKEADEAQRLGITPQEVTSEVSGRFVRSSIFMGAFIKSEFDQVVVPFFEQGASIEYELTRSINTVTQKKRATVGILRTDAQVSGGRDQATFQESPVWQIQTELAKQYVIKEVSAASKIEDDIDMLIAVLPSSLTDQHMGNFVEYVNSGKPVLILDDPFPYNDIRAYGQPKNAPSMPKQAARNPMFGGGGGGPPPEQRADGGQATRLMNALNLEWKNDQVVFDRTNPHPQFRDNMSEEFVFIHRNKSNPEAISTKSELTNGLEELLVIYTGSVKPRVGNKTREFTQLLWTGADNSGEVGFMPLIQSLQRRDSELERETDDEAHVISARITGKKALAKDKLRKALNSFNIDLDAAKQEQVELQLDEIEDKKAADRSAEQQVLWLVVNADAAKQAFQNGDEGLEASLYTAAKAGITKKIGLGDAFSELTAALAAAAKDDADDKNARKSARSKVASIIKLQGFSLDKVKSDAFDKHVKTLAKKKASERSRREQQIWLIGSVAQANVEFDATASRTKATEAEIKTYRKIREGITDEIGSSDQHTAVLETVNFLCEHNKPVAITELNEALDALEKLNYNDGKIKDSQVSFVSRNMENLRGSLVDKGKEISSAKQSSRSGELRSYQELKDFATRLNSTISNGTTDLNQRVTDLQEQASQGNLPQAALKMLSDSLETAKKARGDFQELVGEIEGQISAVEEPLDEIIAYLDPATYINTIYVADVDIVSDMMFEVAQTEVAGLKLDNVRFILNCVDLLAGDDKFVPLRNRRAKFRVLKYLDEQVNEFRDEAEKERAKAGKDAEDLLTKKREDLEAEVKKIDEDDSLSALEKQQRKQMAAGTKQRQLEVEEAKIERDKDIKLKELDTRVKRQTQEEEDNFRFHAVFWPPIPAILFGIMFLIMRIQSERTSIEAARRLN